MGWIAVGLTEDIPVGTVVPRRIDGVDLAVWNSASGQFHAWGDRCPHRGMRLSHGFVRGEVLACIYHGWQYDADGACKYIPAHPDLTPPKSICATSYACTVQGDAIWVALEEPDGVVPDVGNRQPVRSIEIAVSAQDVAARLDVPLAPLMVLDQGIDLAIALQPRDGQSCLMHAFIGADQDRKEASRALEKMRDALEGET